MVEGKDFSLNFKIVSFVILFITISAAARIQRNVTAIGEAAISKGLITAPPKDLDFMKIPPGVVYKLGELLVRFTPKPDGKSPSPAEKNLILSAIDGGSLKRNYELVPGLTLVKLPVGQTVKDALLKFNKTDGILYAEPNYERKAISTFPNDTYFGNYLWNMHNTGQTGGTPDADIDAPEAWDISTGSSDMIIAVIDTGVYYTHEDLAANMWVNEDELNGAPGVDDDQNGCVDDIFGYDYCNNDNNPMDDNAYQPGYPFPTYIYHGTHCAGIAGAVGNNGIGVTGVCWNVKIMALKFLNYYGSGYTADAIDCIEYATGMGANVMSNSWGGGPYSQSVKNAIESAGTAGILFVAAAGNNSSNNDVNPFYPASYSSSNIIAVMSVDENDNVSSYSNRGPTSVDIAAPGDNILSCNPYYGYRYLGGTSMAAPHVAGACALMWSVNPSLTTSEIKDILLDTVDPTLSSYYCVSGGRLNLYNAVRNSQVIPWLKAEPAQGIIGPNGSTNINVDFSAETVDVGTYQGKITITFDDIYNTRVNIPAQLKVQ